MSGSTMLMAISSSGAVTITGEMSGSDAANALLLDGTGSLAFTTTASYNAFSASYAIASGSFSSRTTQVEQTYASTGSNTFTGAQYVSDTSNGIGFTSTASFYTDGGLRVGKNAYVSGTAYFNNIVVFGTSSIQYITSSQVNIGANIITVNTDTPAVRFGGLSVFDSGSTQLTGSMLWDSEKNHWVYSNPSGSTYSGGMFISGPRSSALGSEQGTTACMLLVGQGGDHLTSSLVYHDSTKTCFYGTSLFVSSSGNVGIGTSTPEYALTINANATQTSFGMMTGYTNGNARNWGIGTNVLAYGDFTVHQSNALGGLPFGAGTSKLYISQAGNVGIGTTSPGRLLNISGTGTDGTQVQINGTGDSAGIKLIPVSGDNWEIQANTSNQWFVYNRTDSAYRLLIDGSGNVGIGTSSPTQKLEIINGALSVSTNQTGEGILYGRIAMYSTGAGNAYIAYGGEIRSYSIAGIDQSDLRFYTSPNTGATERMRITSGGSVLIGTTTNNGAALQVNGATYVGLLSATELRIGDVYTNSYTTDATWSSSKVVVPNGVLANLATYMVEFDWDFGGIGGAPYLSSAAAIFRTNAYTNSAGNNNEVALATSSHVGGDYIIYMALRAGNSSTSAGLSARLSWTPAGSGGFLAVRVKRLN
jgi:hypothetical protein